MSQKINTRLIVLTPLLTLGVLLASVVLFRSGGGTTAIKQTAPPQEYPAFDRTSEAHSTALTGPSTIIESSDTRVTSILDAWRDAYERGAREELIDLIVSLGKLLRDPKTRSTDRVCLEQRLVTDSGNSMAMAIALVLSVYDKPADSAVRSILSTAGRKLPSSYALFFSMTLEEMPRAWSESDERNLWREMFSQIPGFAPDDLSTEANARANDSPDFGKREFSGLGGKHSIQMLNRLPSKRVSNPALLQALFDYVNHTFDTDVAYELYPSISLQDASAIHAFVAAYQTAPSDKVRQALSRYIRQVPMQPEQLEKWYSEERLPAVRREIACVLLGSNSGTAVASFEAFSNIEPSQEVKSALVTKLATIQTKAVVEKLMSLGDSGLESDRIRAIRALGNAHRTFLPDLKNSFFVKLLSDPSPEIRHTALESLYGTSGMASLEHFQRLAQSDPVQKVRETAQRIVDKAEK